ncbi:MAG: LysE family translocator [Mesorhizobium sp.]|nr:LysE family translocator [Mesorhizobium sp.]
MVLDPSLTAAYVVLAAALALSPGPDVMFVIANGMRHKAGGAIAAALGIGAGSLLHAAAAAVGVSAVIAASPLAFDAMRVAGALYLAWLGIQAIRAFMSNTVSGQAAPQAGDVSAARVFLRGFLTNLLNPKVIVFYLALLPQFVNVDLGNVGLQVFLLGCIHNVMGLSFLVLVGLAAGKASAWIARTGIGRWLDGIAGLFFLGLAARLALTGRPGD